MSGTGSHTISLPKTLKVKYEQFNLTAAVPDGITVEFNKAGKV